MLKFSLFGFFHIALRLYTGTTGLGEMEMAIEITIDGDPDNSELDDKIGVTGNTLTNNKDKAKRGVSYSSEERDGETAGGTQVFQDEITEENSTNRIDQCGSTSFSSGRQQRCPQYQCGSISFLSGRQHCCQPDKKRVELQQFSWTAEGDAFLQQSDLTAAREVKLPQQFGCLAKEEPELLWQFSGFVKIERVSLQQLCSIATNVEPLYQFGCFVNGENKHLQPFSSTAKRKYGPLCASKRANETLNSLFDVTKRVCDVLQHWICTAKRENQPLQQLRSPFNRGTNRQAEILPLFRSTAESQIVLLQLSSFTAKKQVQPLQLFCFSAENQWQNVSAQMLVLSCPEDAFPRFSWCFTETHDLQIQKLANDYLLLQLECPVAKKLESLHHACLDDSYVKSLPLSCSEERRHTLLPPNLLIWFDNGPSSTKLLFFNFQPQQNHSQSKVVVSALQVIKWICSLSDAPKGQSILLLDLQSYKTLFAGECDGIKDQHCHHGGNDWETGGDNVHYCSADKVEKAAKGINGVEWENNSFGDENNSTWRSSEQKISETDNKRSTTTARNHQAEFHIEQSSCKNRAIGSAGTEAVETIIGDRIDGKEIEEVDHCENIKRTCFGGNFVESLRGHDIPKNAKKTIAVCKSKCDENQIKNADRKKQPVDGRQKFASDEQAGHFQNTEKLVEEQESDRATTDFSQLSRKDQASFMQQVWWKRSKKQTFDVRSLYYIILLFCWSLATAYQPFILKQNSQLPLVVLPKLNRRWRRSSSQSTQNCEGSCFNYSRVDLEWMFRPAAYGVTSAYAHLPLVQREIICYPVARYPDNQNPLLPLSLQKKLGWLNSFITALE